VEDGSLMEAGVTRTRRGTANNHKYLFCIWNIHFVPIYILGETS